jgi:hypothetical protein
MQIHPNGGYSNLQVATRILDAMAEVLSYTHLVDAPQ